MRRAGRRLPVLKVEVLRVIRSASHRYPLYRLTLGTGGSRISLAAGIHGDEPAGVEALLAFLESCTEHAPLLQRFCFVLFPCLNPYGYEHDRRENVDGLDLNRQYRARRPPLEVATMRAALERYDLSIEFHEDCDAEGFYLYELKSHRARAWLGEAIVQAVGKTWPVDQRQVIEELQSANGIIRPVRIQQRIQQLAGWPHAIYLHSTGTRRCLTFETPTRWPMEARVAMHLTALHTTLAHLG